MTEEDGILAAEHVLGLGDAAQQAQSAARIATDPAFAAEVESWHDKFAPLLNGPEIVPPADIWEKVHTAIGHERGENDNPRPVRIFTASALMAACFVAVASLSLWFASPVAPPPKDRSALIAILSGDKPGIAITARFDPVRKELALRPDGVSNGNGYPELWIIPTGGVARSLGAVHDDQPSRLTLSSEEVGLLIAGATLAITDEPDAAIPHQKAGGPIIAKGTIISI